MNVEPVRVATWIEAGARDVVGSSQTPALDPAEARLLLDSVDVTTHSGLRDRF